MHDAGFVRCRQPFGHLMHDINRALEWHASAPHLGAERVAVDELRDQVLNVSVATNVVDREDIRVVQRAGSNGFLSEALLPLWIERGVVMEDFDGNESLQA